MFLPNSKTFNLFLDNNLRTKFNDIMDFDFAKALVCYERAYVEKPKCNH